MRRGELVMGSFFLIAGLYAVVSALHMRFYVGGGPGPGFFPLFLGAGIIGCSTATMARSVLRDGPTEVQSFLPPPATLVRGAVVLALIGAFAIAAPAVGFRVAMFVVLLVLMSAVMRTSWRMAIATALVGSVAAYYFFDVLLEVYLPPATVYPLDRMGL